MRHVTYAWIGPEDAAGKFAKKGTATDITLWNAKQGDAHLNLVTATRFPEKILSLLYTLDLADEIVLAPQVLDRSFGEAAIAAQLLGKTKGFLRPGPQIPIEQVQALLAKTGLAGLTASTETDPLFRERLYERATAPAGGSLVLAVDHSFPVKGVGTVILGLVRSGEAKPHENLRAYPGTKTVDVRSVQVHDVDQKSAGPRSRVGLAVKGVEPDDVRRGTVLAPPGSLQVWDANQPRPALLRPAPFSKWQPRAGAVLHAFHVLQDVVVRIDSAAAPTPQGIPITLRPESPFAHVPNQPVVAVDVDDKTQRLVGTLHDA